MLTSYMHDLLCLMAALVLYWCTSLLYWIIGPAVRADFRRLYPANAKTPTCCPSDDNRTKVTNSVTSARSLWWHVDPRIWRGRRTPLYPNPCSFIPLMHLYVCVALWRLIPSCSGIQFNWENSTWLWVVFTLSSFTSRDHMLPLFSVVFFPKSSNRLTEQYSKCGKM